MKALMKMSHDVGDVHLQDIPEPECRPGMVKVKIKYCGICGTDLHIYHDTFTYYPPVIMGHEMSGTVIETGEGITDIQKGDRVAILGSTMITCGTCEYCRAGYYMFCKTRRGMGHGTHGGFTEYVVVREDQCYKLPENVSYETGAVIEAFATSVQAVEELIPFGPGDTVLISGPGPIGLLTLALVVAHGCRVIVAGTASDSKRLETALKMGAAATIDVGQQDLVETVKTLTNGRGADIAIDCSGAAKSIDACLSALRNMGTHIQLGIAGKPITMDFDKTIFKRIQVFGSVGHSLKTWDTAMRILGQNKVDLGPVISHIMPLAEWEKAFDMLEKKDALKILLQCS